MLVSILSAIGSLIATVATNGCIFGWVDEPTMPKSMIEK